MLGCLAVALTPAVAQQPADRKNPSAPAEIGELSVAELMTVRVDKVYGASKFEQKITEAPSSVTIITADQIRKYGYRTLADILRSVPGFYVNNDRNYSYVGLRGFARPGDYNTRILVLLDGHETNENVYGAAYIGTDFPVDVDLIDHVEIIRGPGSAVYGTGAFLGVVNVVTRKGSDIGGLEVSASGGGQQSYQGRVSYGWRFSNGLDLLLSGTDYDSKGNRRLFFPEFDSPSENNGITQDADTDKFHSFFAAAEYRGFSLHAGYSSREKRVPTASFDTAFNDRRTLTVDARSYVDLQYRHKFESNLELTARAFYDRYDYDGLYIYPPAEAPIVNLDSANGVWAGFEFNVTKRLFEKHRVTIGTEFRFNFKQNQQTFDVDPYKLYLSDKRSSIVPAFYVQDEFTIRKNLILSAGVRADRYYSFGTTVNPRLALVYSPAENTAIKLIYGSAFRAPSSYEVYYYPNSTMRLQPETIRSTELVLERYLSTHTWVRASVFYNQLSGLISQTTDPATGSIQFTNLDIVHSKGLETELNEKRPNGWEGRLSYTLQSSKDGTSDEVLSNSPKQLVKLNLIAPVVKKLFFAGFEGQYTSRRRTISGADTGGFFLANFTLYTQPIADRLQVSASVYNLFGKRYADPGAVEHLEQAIPQDGRNFRIKLSYRF